jgi:hypothetical protein
MCPVMKDKIANMHYLVSAAIIWLQNKEAGIWHNVSPVNVVRTLIPPI